MTRGVRGISEVTAIIVMIMIAVVAAFGVKSYIDYQSSKLPSTDIAVARYTVSYSAPGTGVVALVVSNLLPGGLNVTSVTIVLSNGTQVTPQMTPLTAGGRSDVYLVLPVSLQPGVSVSKVLVGVTDLSSGRSQVVFAAGG
ncbi:archaellin/type IV pilin N-terminal domain-containing protein [Desulfurococcus mucosus]|uniref:Flagellar protein G n=1 Tax=Desulfurococcus mucosus (strain ATCC 35584 / DSM 2162 / JCM 9187 / O7/1) TaxID=765177 RepID=E8R8G5_DESM0|nr:archaellin/type IV pilin N-terminal domain-containing protein [Desulfurococcus mucosus]ADV64791.1 flagellar protein G [Desulfurococcus mucosus DSM 2162]